MYLLSSGFLCAFRDPIGSQICPKLYSTLQNIHQHGNDLPVPLITRQKMSSTIEDDSVSMQPPRKKVKTDYYSRDVDFDVLAKHDADFAAISKSAKQDGWIDFHNPKVVQ